MSEHTVAIDGVDLVGELRKIDRNLDRLTDFEFPDGVAEYEIIQAIRQLIALMIRNTIAEMPDGK